MKTNRILLGAIALLATLGMGQAQTVVEITGATAFRTATLTALKARFDAGGNYRYGHNGTNYTGSNVAIFEGTFPGVTGTTIVRTSFNGSVEGIRALVDSPASNPLYIDPTLLTGSHSATPTAQTGLTETQTAQSEIAFSDVNVASTPFAASTLEPSDAGVGVVVFTMLANESAPANFTNISNKQFEALVTQGFQELSLFTGESGDDGKYVFAVGRNDGSGTRTTYMAESGTGITTLIQQYIATASSNNVTALQLAGTTGSNISTVWNQNVDGNGGYSSGSALRGIMDDTSGSVDVYFSPLAVIGTDTPDLDNAAVTLVTFLSIGDAQPAIVAGAKALAFNGVSITPANPLSAADQDKIAYGAYTAWGFQQMYRRTGLSTDQLAVDSGIRTNIPANIGSAGIPNSVMQVDRAVDGGIVTSQL